MPLKLSVPVSCVLVVGQPMAASGEATLSPRGTRPTHCGKTVSNPAKTVIRSRASNERGCSPLQPFAQITGGGATLLHSSTDEQSWTVKKREGGDCILLPTDAAIGGTLPIRPGERAAGGSWKRRQKEPPSNAPASAEGKQILPSEPQDHTRSTHFPSPPAAVEDGPGRKSPVSPRACSDTNDQQQPVRARQPGERRWADRRIPTCGR